MSSIEVIYRFLDLDRILVVEDCLPFAAEFINLCNSNQALFRNASLVNNTQNQYTDLGHRSSMNLSLDNTAPKDLLEYDSKMREVILWAKNLYFIKNKHLRLTGYENLEILRYTMGEQFGEHIDAINGALGESLRKLSVVLYLNDNYIGGELHLTRHQIKYKPKAGSLIMFPSDFGYPHASLPITDGVKYSVVTWFR